jgi:hypothetical protein
MISRSLVAYCTTPLSLPLSSIWRTACNGVRQHVLYDFFLRLGELVPANETTCTPRNCRAWKLLPGRWTTRCRDLCNQLHLDLRPLPDRRCSSRRAAWLRGP